MSKNISDLQKLRVEIDSVDRVLLSALAKRMELVKAVGKYKHDHNLKLLDIKRWSEVMKATLMVGGAISHHHGVGLVRKPWIKQALGPTWGAWANIKKVLDPQGILNPDKWL